MRWKKYKNAVQRWVVFSLFIIIMAAFKVSFVLGPYGVGVVVRFAASQENKTTTSRRLGTLDQRSKEGVSRQSLVLPKGNHDRKFFGSKS